MRELMMNWLIFDNVNFMSWLTDNQFVIGGNTTQQKKEASDNQLNREK